MATTPWKSYSTADPEREYAALLSYLPLKRAWRLPWLILQSIRIQRQLRASRGLIGYSLRAQLAVKRFWTLSAWEDEATLQRFVRAPPHVEIMTATRPAHGQDEFRALEGKGFRTAAGLGRGAETRSMSESYRKALDSAAQFTRSHPGTPVLTGRRSRATHPTTYDKSPAAWVPLDRAKVRCGPHPLSFLAHSRALRSR
jgi:hypothetical protein